MRIVKNTIGICLCIMLPLGSAMAGTTMLSKNVKNGERFDISLRSNPSTGYTWMLRTLPAAEKVLEQKGFAESKQPLGSRSN